MNVDVLNRDLQSRTEPLMLEADCLRKRMADIEAEIQQYIRAIGQGTSLTERLTQAVQALERDKQALQGQHEALKRRMSEEAVREYDSVLVKRALGSFRASFDGLPPQEQAEALQSVLKGVEAHPGKLVLEVYELAEFRPGLTNRQAGLPGEDSNLQ